MRQNATPLAPVTLVLGGARSGKSAHGEALIAASGPGLYLATANAGDGEMAERIRRHRRRRGPDWTTLEEPLDVAGVLGDHAGRPVLVDCLTLWLANIMAAGRDPEAETRRLIGGLTGLSYPVVLISGEVGSGIIPANALARAFADAAGTLNQTVAACAQRAVLVTAGIPLTLKEENS